MNSVPRQNRNTARHGVLQLVMGLLRSTTWLDVGSKSVSQASQTELKSGIIWGPMASHGTTANHMLLELVSLSRFDSEFGSICPPTGKWFGACNTSIINSLIHT